MTPYADPADTARYGAEHYRKRVAQERIARLEQAREHWPEIDPLELAWAAGLFEGEGTCSITARGTDGWTRGAASVSAVDRQTVAFFRERWAGHISLTARDGNAHDVYVWSVRGVNMYRFLRQVQPFLRRDLVRGRFDVVIADFERRILDPRNNAARDAALRESRILNHRGLAPIVLDAP